MKADCDRELLLTRDGSHTVLVPSLDITYRSRHGAIQESMHVFIDAGLKYIWSRAIAAGSDEVELELFELGFGTGLNALLSCQEALKTQRKIRYTAIEPHPIETEIFQQLNYPDPHGYLTKMHGADWNEWIDVHEYFRFIKHKITLANFEPHCPSSELVRNKPDAQCEMPSVRREPGSFDLVYFDAFGPSTQPEIWSAESFAKVASLMRPGAVLTTYCSKSVVRRTMMSVGLQVTKIPGPYGKREMVRASK